jgi:EpsI family protein
MKETKISHHQSVIFATLTASVIMLASGLTYRVLATRLATPSQKVPIDPSRLAQFPMEIGDWTGQDVALDEAIVRRTGTDAHLNRRYINQTGLEAVSFYVAYGVQARDLVAHRPEVCYIGNGWALMDKRFLELPLGDGTMLPCNVMQFSRGGLLTDKLVVLDYYLVDGQYCHDVSLLRFKAWRGSGTVDYVVHVQITTPVIEIRGEGSVETKRVSDFAIASASVLAGIFEKPEPPMDSE